jgi:hypothetical protein
MSKHSFDGKGDIPKVVGRAGAERLNSTSGDMGPMASPVSRSIAKGAQPSCLWSVHASGWSLVRFRRLWSTLALIPQNFRAKRAGFERQRLEIAALTDESIAARSHMSDAS